MKVFQVPLNVYHFVIRYAVRLQSESRRHACISNSVTASDRALINRSIALVLPTIGPIVPRCNRIYKMNFRAVLCSLNYGLTFNGDTSHTSIVCSLLTAGF